MCLVAMSLSTVIPQRPFESNGIKQLSPSSCGWVLIRSFQWKITLPIRLTIPTHLSALELLDGSSLAVDVTLKPFGGCPTSHLSSTDPPSGVSVKSADSSQTNLLRNISLKLTVYSTNSCLDDNQHFSCLPAGQQTCTDPENSCWMVLRFISDVFHLHLACLDKMVLTSSGVYV